MTAVRFEYQLSLLCSESSCISTSCELSELYSTRFFTFLGLSEEDSAPSLRLGELESWSDCESLLELLDDLPDEDYPEESDF